MNQASTFADDGKTKEETMKSLRRLSDADKSSDKEKRTPHATTLFVKVEKWQWPIVYSPEYNIGFMGLEKVHPFDAAKWGRVHKYLIDFGMVQNHTTVRPQEATLEDLMVVHPKRYIDSLKWSITVAGITEVPPVALLPNFLVQRKVLRPFRFHTGGTILAAKLAVERGWAINIGGGFHHCCADRGGGFCAYADITLAIRFLQQHGLIEKAMIIDLDAHQGNGHERDFMSDRSVYILDIYNRSIYPHDGFAKRGISRKIELSSYTEDEEYLNLVRTHSEGALNEFKPDIVIYNAGTDILAGDPLGCLSISPQGIVERDEIVFRKALSRGIPILMVTSGGYQKSTAQIIANSILNLHSLDLIDCPDAANAPPPPAVPEPHPTVESVMKRSTSEGMGFFSRLRRSTNCWAMSKSQTSQNINKTANSGRNFVSSQPKLDISPDSSDEDYPSLEIHPAFSEPDVRKPDYSLANWTGFRTDEQEKADGSEDPESDEIMSLAEALSGLRHEVPPSLRNIKVVECQVNSGMSGADIDLPLESKSKDESKIVKDVAVVVHQVDSIEPCHSKNFELPETTRNEIEIKQDEYAKVAESMTKENVNAKVEMEQKENVKNIAHGNYSEPCLDPIS